MNCGYQRLHKTALVTPSLASMITCQLDGINCRAGSQRKLFIFFSSRLGNKKRGSLWLILAYPCSLWLPSGSLCGSHSHSRSFRLILTHSGSLSGSLRRSSPHKVLAQLATTSLLGCHSLSRPACQQHSLSVKTLCHCTSERCAVNVCSTCSILNCHWFLHISFIYLSLLYYKEQQQKNKVLFYTYEIYHGWKKHMK